MNETMQNLMREATRLTQSGNLMEATAAIQRALGNARGAPMPPAPAPTPASAAIILDGCIFEVAEPGAPASKGQGEFTEGSHTHASLTRRYKLYTPPGSFGDVGKGLPLVVMLHGCTQNPDDFAAGTGMNELARQQGFCVLYPAQAADANPQRCWNWFKHTHQTRGRGEAALLADLTLSIIKQYSIDPRRVYVAGLSAGGAMAAIVAAAYPEIYAAAGVHSGLAVGAASNVSEALTAMKTGTGKRANGSAGVGVVANGSTPGRTAQGQATGGRAVPTIVFHGDQDHTVHPRNGEQVIAAVQGGTSQRVEQGVASGGRRFTRTVHLKRNGIESDDAGSAVAEHWLVHGAGHAWSGGNSKGSYTDPQGPDASREMLRFFMAHSLPGN
jgi:poly(hydroxyalkanoate) depolymerase family esterase